MLLQKLHLLRQERRIRARHVDSSVPNSHIRRPPVHQNVAKESLACLGSLLLLAGPVAPAQAVVELQPPDVTVCSVETVRGTGPGANLLADLAGLFGGDGEVPEERDPITPFTLYGTSFKKFLIEQLNGEKVVARKKGFTVETCVGAVDVNQETPQFQGLPSGDKALYAKERICRKAEGTDLKETCRSSCQSACTDTLTGYATALTEESGFRLLDKDQERLLKSCTRNCSYECSKPGKAFDFVIPYRK